MANENQPKDQTEKYDLYSGKVKPPPPKPPPVPTINKLIPSKPEPKK